MSNRIDQLFKNKLGEHKVSPSAEAWTKVQSSLSKKNKLIVAWRMAAVIVLGGVLISTWQLLNNEESGVPALVTTTNDIVVPEETVIEKPAKSISSVAEKKVVQAKPDTRREESESDKLIKNHILITGSIPVNIPEDEIEPEANITTIEPLLIAQSVKPEKPIVIEFTLESIAKEPITEIAQNAPAENTGLKKILEAALDIKNGDTDLGILRDTKNQLFAFDFKKNKPKRN